MKKIGLFLVLFFFVSVVLRPANFTENFDDGNYYGWLEPMVLGEHFDWNVESGELHGSFESTNFGGGVLYSPVGAVTDFTCEFISTRKTTGGAFTDGVMRVSVDGRFIAWQVVQDTAVMLSYDDGAGQQVLFYEAEGVGEYYHTMKLQVTGSAPTLTVSVWWDGTPKWTGDITGVSDALSQGHIGLFASGDTASIWFDDFDLIYTSYVGLEEAKATAPIINLLSQNIPNPSIRKTTIEYTISNTSQVQLKIYNTLGEVVRTLVDNRKSPGRYKVIWDGKDENGNKVPSGQYFYQLITNGFANTKKIILLK